MLSAVIPAEHSYPAMLLAEQPDHQRFVRSGPLVLRTASRRSPAPTADRDRTVSRRSEPSSRTALISEQLNPWDLLQPQDAMSRHRGINPRRRCELLGAINLLSPAYLLSDDRWPSHMEATGSLCPTFVPARSVDLTVKLSCAITLDAWFPIRLREPLSDSVTL